MAPKSVFVKAQEMEIEFNEEHNNELIEAQQLEALRQIVFNEEYDNEQLEALRRAMEDCGSTRG